MTLFTVPTPRNTHPQEDDHALSTLVTTASTVVELSPGEAPSTKAAKAAFAAITERRTSLLVIARAEDVVALSA